MNDQRIAIITDSGTNTPQSFVREHDVRVVPLLINYKDGSSYRSGVDISCEEVIARLDTEIPSTSLPTPQQIRNTIEQARADGYERGVFVSISSTLSATYQTVKMVASQMDDFELVVCDSKSIGVVAGMIVMRAAQMVESGTPFSELGARLADLAETSRVYFVTRTLDYLYKGGRINQLTYRLGSVLNIKPIITCNEDGRYVVAKKSRGWDRAISMQIGLIRAHAKLFDKVRIGICCTEACDMFDELEKRVTSEVDNIVEIVRSGLSADLIVHTGPELIGLGVQPVQ